MRNARVRRRRCRAGLSLPEVIVALALLTVGALSVAATSGAVARLSNSSRTRDAAARALATVLDSLRATPCVDLAGGTRSDFAGTVVWSVVRLSSVASINGSIAPPSRRGGAPIRVETLQPCE